MYHVIGVSMDEVISESYDHLITTDHISGRPRTTVAGHSYLNYLASSRKAALQVRTRALFQGPGSGGADLREYLVGMHAHGGLGGVDRRAQ